MKKLIINIVANKIFRILKQCVKWEYIIKKVILKV